MLLPRCMRHLLAVAMTKADGADSSADQSSVEDGNNTDQMEPSAEQTTASAGLSGDWKSTVHALNVLRVIFVDATLADDVGPYVTEVGRDETSNEEFQRCFQGKCLLGPRPCSHALVWLSE